jgi:hypothetical protein
MSTDPTPVPIPIPPASTSPDIPTIQHTIDSAISTMGAEDRFNLLLHADRTSGSIGILWKLGGHVEAVAKVTKPWRDRWEPSADIRVHFAFGGYAFERGDSFLVRWYRAYLLFHHLPSYSPNSLPRSVVKSLGLILNRHPYLDGRRWFA